MADAGPDAAVGAYEALGGGPPVSGMDTHYDTKNEEYLDRLGNALNVGVHELADVLNRFWLNEVRLVKT